MAEPAHAAEPKPRRDPAHRLTLAQLEERVGTRVGAQQLATTLSEEIAGGHADYDRVHADLTILARPGAGAQSRA